VLDSDFNNFSNFYQIETKQISCEYISIFDYQSKKSVKGCHLYDMTSIDFPNVTFFTRDSTVEAVFFKHNKKIFYLPETISHAYPSLKVIQAFYCSIKKNSKQNFMGLAELGLLNVSFNQIEKIASGTFEGLKALTALTLG
jgi:Leucine rich repeat